MRAALAFVALLLLAVPAHAQTWQFSTTPEGRYQLTSAPEAAHPTVELQAKHFSLGRAATVIYLDTILSIGSAASSIHDLTSGGPGDVTQEGHGLQIQPTIRLDGHSVTHRGMDVRLLTTTSGDYVLNEQAAIYIADNAKGPGVTVGKSFGLLMEHNTGAALEKDNWTVWANGVSHFDGIAVNTSNAGFTNRNVIGRDTVVFSIGSATQTLPAASTIAAGRIFTIKKTGTLSDGPVTVASAGGLIDGAPLVTLTNPGAYVTVVSDGADYWVIGMRE